MIVPLVAVLFFSRGPANIAGLVVTILVGETVDGVTERWRLTNISDEGSEVTPSGTNRDTSTAPEVVSGCIGVCASPDHLCPTAVGSRFGFPMSSSRLGCSLSLETPTTLSATAAQLVERCYGSASARTIAVPNNFGTTAGCSRFFKVCCDQPPKDLTGDICVGLHAALYRLSVSDENAQAYFLSNYRGQYATSA